MTPAMDQAAAPAERARLSTIPRRVLPLGLLPLWLLVALPSWSAGTTAGTVIDNVATVNFDLGGINNTQDSNTVSITVLERIDVVVTLQSGQVTVAPNQTDASLLFTVTNTGNGNDAFTLAIDSTVTGDDFEPIPGVPAIYFDSDASGDFSAGDVQYQAGINDPPLAADASVDVLLVNNIPGAVTNGQLGRSELTATSTTGTGLPGDTLVGLGDGGLDAVVGASGAEDDAFGEYLVSDVDVRVQKSVVASDPFGGSEPTVGATLTYTITVEVLNSGTAAASVISDPIPTYSTFVADSIRLNGGNLTDAVDTDAGELDTSAAPAVVVRLGDLTLADGIQTIAFQVTIDKLELIREIPKGIDMKTLLKLTLITSAFFATSAAAQEKGHLNVRTVVQKEEVTVNEAGETERRLVAADTVIPGDDVVYTITFTNISDEVAENIVITNPISENLTYVEGSAFGPGTVIEFSVDGGETFGAASELMVSANGGQRPADAGDFTHVRWTMQNQLEAGAQGMARFRARLN